MYKIKNTRLISESRISIYTKYFIVPTANINGKDIKLTANAGDANKVSVATPVKVKLTITTSTNEKVEDTITVNLTPYPAQ